MRAPTDPTNEISEPGAVRPTWKPHSRRALLLATASLAVVTPPFAAAAYWHYVNTVPPFVRSPSCTPDPDGYQQAARAVDRLQQLQPSLDRKWRTAPAPALAPLVTAAAPPLAQVRRALAWDWRKPPSLTEEGSSRANFLVAAEYLAAESRLHRLQGDPAGALRCSVDAMELGCRTCESGKRPSGQGYQTLGMEQAQRCADSAPLAGLAAQLTRVRRLRLTWPRAAESLEYDRQIALADLTDRLQVSTTQTLWQQLDEAEEWLSSQSPSILPGASLFGHGVETWKTVLTPRAHSLALLERQFRELKIRASSPVRDGYGPPPLTDHWARRFDPGQMGGYRWEWPRHNLALLETALAVRLFRLEHGRYPTNLREIEPKRLPEIPTDAWDQPIAYRIRNGRPVIYSVGRDGVDDGGKAVHPDTLIEHGMGDAVWGKLCSSDWPTKP